MIKVTHGWVSQNFDNNGRLLDQDFYAGDEVRYEDEDGEEIYPEDGYYAPFDMVQPEDNKDAISLTWCTDDIKHQAATRGIELSDMQARHILHLVKRGYDHAIGVNWSTIDATTDMYLEGV